VNDLVEYTCEVLSQITMAPEVCELRRGKIIEVEKNKITIEKSLRDVKHESYNHRYHNGTEDTEEEEEPYDEVFLHNFHYLAVKKEGVAEERLAKFKELEKSHEDASASKKKASNDDKELMERKLRL